MGIALQRRPGPVAGNSSRVWNVVADLEQARDAFVPQVVKPQILDPQKLRCPSERSADRVGGVGEDLARVFGHRLDDC